METCGCNQNWDLLPLAVRPLLHLPLDVVGPDFLLSLVVHVLARECSSESGTRSQASSPLHGGGGMGFLYHLLCSYSGSRLTSAFSPGPGLVLMREDQSFL